MYPQPLRVWRRTKLYRYLTQSSARRAKNNPAFFGAVFCLYLHLQASVLFFGSKPCLNISINSSTVNSSFLSEMGSFKIPFSIRFI